MDGALAGVLVAVEGPLGATGAFVGVLVTVFATAFFVGVFVTEAFLVGVLVAVAAKQVATKAAKITRVRRRAIVGVCEWERRAKSWKDKTIQ